MLIDERAFLFGQKSLCESKICLEKVKKHLEQAPLVFGFILIILITSKTPHSFPRRVIIKNYVEQQQQQRKRAREGEAKEHRGHRKRDRG